MQINISVDGLDAIDLNTVIDGEPIRRYNHDTEEYEQVTPSRTLGDLVADKLADKLWGDLTHEDRIDIRRAVQEERIKVVREHLAPIVEKTLTEQIQRTNGYGEPSGGTVTMRELVIAEVGKVINGKTDRYSSSSRPLIDEVVNRVVVAALVTELDKVFKAEKEKVIAAVRAQAADLIANAVSRGVGR
ncbi:hypothetical protein [Actinoplanes siamensis]|uniref:Uncharacterized protein n=1 Tax=Actinoplanes siamensis TaxID=1223317 RepID=A0A919NCK3_9ACTN|nr:hypothetical protein [Actinoplanes siamensis]GIF08719.1 hypothetical protein Asi03nite_62570 [Actinoplanes siamensis]